MAANAPAPIAAKKGPLSSFERISKIVYLYRPQTSLSGADAPRSFASSRASPKLILVGGWMDAQEAHLAKYTAKYQALYPDSHILLMRSFVYHFVGSKFPGEIAPSVPVIRSILGQGDGAGGSNHSPEMLVHVFSNGGSTTLKYLYDLYPKTARRGESSTPFPAHATIFDSAPGRFQWSRSVTAFSLSAARSNFLVRMFVTAMAHMMSALYWVLTVPWARGGFLERTWLAHNVKTKNQTETRRTYVYSKDDQLVDYRDIEEHAAQAREQGYQVTLEEFKGTAHVAHARGDEGRYWTIVRDTWENAK